MMPQSRLGSFVESMTNTIISYIIAVIIGYFVYRAFSVPIDLVTNMKITAIFTLASILRGYVIRRWFNSFHVSPPVIQPAPVIPPEPVSLTPRQLEGAIQKLHHFLLHEWPKSPRDQINVVQCSVKFPGWGYIAGCSQGWWINNELSIVPGDDDMGFSEICIVVKNVAAILIETRYESDLGRWAVRLQIVTPELEDRILFRGMIFETIEDYLKLPPPIQKVMHDVLAEIHKIYQQTKIDPADAMMEYAHGKS